MQQIKRHHYVPKAYLKAFCDDKGKLLVYRKDSPSEPLKVAPDNTQFRRYYYSQPTSDGGQDNNSLEALFSTIETDWPTTVTTLSQRGDVNSKIENIFEFIALQRARVPASRDMVEAMEAQCIKDTITTMFANGQLPPPPPGLEDLPNLIEVAIDPHQSIYGMQTILQGMAVVIDKLGFVVVHNTTERPFLTSDNPVLWFDPTLSFDEQKPYNINPEGAILFFFPVSPSVCLLGSPDYLERYSRYGFEHYEAPNEEWIEMMNAQICRFAYEAVIASQTGQEGLIKEFADISPVHEASTLKTLRGTATIHQHVFGKRKAKPKWNSK